MLFALALITPPLAVIGTNLISWTVSWEKLNGRPASATARWLALTFWWAALLGYTAIVFAGAFHEHPCN
jgi:hypothetical protein